MSVHSTDLGTASGSAADRVLIEELRAGLRALADPAKAPGMRQYMRSELPFHGVSAQPRDRLAKQLFAEHPLSERGTWTATVRALWDEATHREERYLAIALTGYRGYQHWQSPRLLPLYEYLIVSGGWWDFVDEIAIRRVGSLLRAHPAELTPAMYEWARDPDPWKRRCAVICQIGSGEDIDVDLLTDAVEANIADRDFFLRKGIGWALRQHARVAPDWVAGFVDAHPTLSPLSRKEALKHIGKPAK